MRYLIAFWILLLSGHAAAEIQNFTTVDQYGHVQMGTVITQPNGGQVYQWNDSTGRHQTDTGYVSPPMGNQRTFSTYDGDTGRTNIGTIYGVKPGNDLLLPSSPGKPIPDCMLCLDR